jgi:kynureninase
MSNPPKQMRATVKLMMNSVFTKSREQFFLPSNVIYLDGNSLGALPKAVVQRMQQVVGEQWGQDLIRSWNTHAWIELPQRVGAKIARLVGASPDSVIAADSTSLNIYKLLLSTLSMRPGRRIIISDIGNFPTDLYIAQGIVQLLGNQHELILSETSALADTIAAHGEDVAVVMLTQVDYRTGALHDIEHMTRKIHQVGALAIWDLAHSAGIVPLALEAWGVDFAVGCGYKYLCGGPGAPAFAYIHPRYHPDLAQNTLPVALSGWMGHSKPFDFDPYYHPSPDLRQLLVGTPAVLSLSALDTALDVFDGLDMAVVRQESLALTTRFIELMEPIAEQYEFALVTPRDPHQRGSQVSYGSDYGYHIVQALIQAGVVGDFRAPNIMRFGFTPLYISLDDVAEAVARFAAVMQQGAWRDQGLARLAVT